MMANRAMELELEDFTYDDDGIPIPLPVSSANSGRRISTSNNNKNKGYTNKALVGDNSVNESTEFDTKHKQSHPTAKQRNRKRNQQSTDIFDLDNEMPDVETIYTDRPETIAHVDLANVAETDTKYTKHAKPPAAAGKKSPSQQWLLNPRAHNFTDVDNWEGDLQAMFEVDGVGHDVMLTQTKLLFSPMAKRKKGRRKLSGIFRSVSRSSLSAGSSLNIDSSGSEFIRLEDIFAAKIKQQRSPQQNKGEGVCQGFNVFTYERKDMNKLRVKTMAFLHPSESLAIQWCNRITSILQEFTNRPRKVKVILQPHAGKKESDMLYRARIAPMLKLSGIEGDLMEVEYNEHIKQEMIHMDLEGYDCVLCIGGDGTVRQTTSALLTRSQEDHGAPIKKGFTPVKSKIPLAIIATGTTNHIARSVMGTDDPITGALHLVLGHTSPVDVCSVYSDDRLVTWAFNSQYGYAGNVLQYADRYQILGQKKVDAAFLKALTKAKLRPYQCDIEYIPSLTSDVSHPKDGTVCVQGCDVCRNPEGGHDSISSDLVEDYDPLGHSGTSSTIMDLTSHNPWRQCKGQYLNVGLFSIPGRENYAPQGVSKYSHLSDGCMDLVLVKDVDRKEFVRYLKRHGNSKNQFDFPFVETHRVQEIKFRPRLPITWNYKDYNFSEIDYEMSKVEQRLHTKTKSMNEIDIDDDDDDDSDDDGDDDDQLEALRLSKRCQSMNLRDGVREKQETSDTESTQENDEDEKGPNRKSTAGEHPPSNVTPIHNRMSFTDREILRRRKMAAKKDGKKKAKEETKMRSVWNLDNEIYDANLEIDMKVHHGLLQICCQGISPQTEPEEVRVSCLPMVIR